MKETYTDPCTCNSKARLHQDGLFEELTCPQSSENWVNWVNRWEMSIPGGKGTMRRTRNKREMIAFEDWKKFNEAGVLVQTEAGDVGKGQTL